MLSKRLINSNDAAAGGACTTNTNDYPTTNVAYYKMSTAADEKGTYNGTATNVNFNVQGKYGNAGSFNGSSSNVTIAGSSFDYAAMTLSCWFNLSTTSQNYQTIFNNYSQTSGQNRGWHIRYETTGDLRFYGFNNSNNEFNILQSTTINASTWYHLAVTISSSQIKIYQNNDLINTTNISSSIGYSGTGGFPAIGSYRYAAASYGNYFNGKIDQVRIFDSALDATQVASLYNEVYCVPTIVPTNNFTPITYTGNGSTQSTNSLLNQVGSVDFAPDFVWIKRRDNAIGNTNNLLFDSVRGAGERLMSNVTNAESTETDELTSFNSNGFTVGADVSTNGSGGSIVAWSWKAGGAPTATNSAGAGNVPTSGSVMIDGVASTATLAGSIAATEISANTAAGFSIVSFTSNGAASPVSTGHGLSSVPELVIFKNRDDTSQWPVFHKDIGFNGRLQLEDTASVSTFTPFFDITSTTIAVRQSSLASNGNECIAYCFHSVDGYSKIGSYTGNGSATGPIVVTGFRPAFVMLKCTTSSGTSWRILDNKRNTSNPINKYLEAQDNFAEATSNHLNFYSNGFQVITTDTSINASGSNVIYLAFAEEALPYVTRNAINPFGDSSELALYKFEDNATDAEGNYSSTTLPNVTFATGYIDKAAVFNGSSSLISLPTGVDRNNNFTLSFWVNFDTLSDYDSLITLQINYRVYVNAMANGSLDFKGGETTLSTNAGVVTTGNWYNIVCTKSSTLVGGKATIIYVNGVEVASNNNTSNAPAANDTGLNLLGAYNANAAGGNFFYLDGKLDQVRIFNRALDDGEVTALYNE